MNHAPTPPGNPLLKHALSEPWGEGDVAPWIRRRKGVAALLKDAAAAPADLLRRPMLLAETISLQLAIFLLEALTLWAVFRVLAVPVDLWIAFTAFVSASMAATIGLIPLGLGTFEAGCLAVLGMLGIGVETALAATLLLRELSFLAPDDSRPAACPSRDRTQPIADRGAALAT